MKYIIIPNVIRDVASKDKLNLIWTYFLIRSNIKDASLCASISESEMASLLNKDERTIRRYIAKLKECGFFTNVEKVNGIETKYKYNRYHLIDYKDNYFAVDANYLLEDVPLDVKKFLLLLKTICLDGTNYYIPKDVYKEDGKLNKKSIYTTLHLTNKTFDKLLKQAIECKQLEVIGNGFKILNGNFLFYINDNCREKQLYLEIVNVCNKHKVYYPQMWDKPLSTLMASYPYSKEELASFKANTNDANNIALLDSYDFTKQLEDRINWDNWKGKQLNWGYLIKVMCNKEIISNDVEPFNYVI